jgi:hypothetical protein
VTFEGKEGVVEKVFCFFVLFFGVI